MGRGQNMNFSHTAATDDGEIAFLDADPLEEATGIETIDSQLEVVDPDTAAINNLVRKLSSTAAGQGASSEKLFDTAAALYSKNCDLIASGKATEEQIEKAAALFGESVESLKARLSEEVEDISDEDDLMNNIFNN